MLLAGRRSRLSDLVREPGALGRRPPARPGDPGHHRATAPAARRAGRPARRRDGRLGRGHRPPYLRPGPAARRPPAPARARRGGLRPRPRTGDPAQPGAGRAPAGRVRRAAGRRADRRAGRRAVGRSFDPLPMLERLAQTCAGIPGFEVEPRLVVGVFPEVVPALVAELEARGPALLRHPTVRLLTGPLADASSTAAGLRGTGASRARRRQRAAGGRRRRAGRRADRGPGAGRQRRDPGPGRRGRRARGRRAAQPARRRRTPTSWPTCGAGWPGSAWPTWCSTSATTRTTVPASRCGCSAPSRRPTRPGR